MVTALERFATKVPGHRGQAGLLLTSDEEGLAEDGVKAVARLLGQRGIAPDYCLVGEPSSQEVFGDTVRIGRRGSISARLWVEGVQGHTAFPHTIDNPVHRMAPFLAELVTAHWDDGDGDFPPTHCQVSNLQAGTGAENVTPGVADLMFNFRNAPPSPAAALKTRIESMLGRHDIERYRLEWRVSGEPFRSEAGPLRAAVREIINGELGIEPEMNTGGGTSDGRFIAPLGSEVLEFGVRNHSIHKIDEHAAVAELEALERVYLRVLDKLLIG
jgi:succinyl-diaminopimelate desuccinylase